MSDWGVDINEGGYRQVIGAAWAIKKTRPIGILDAVTSCSRRSSSQKVEDSIKENPSLIWMSLTNTCVSVPITFCFQFMEGRMCGLPAEAFIFSSRRPRGRRHRRCRRADGGAGGCGGWGRRLGGRGGVRL